MLKTIGFIVVVYMMLSLLGAVPAHTVVVDGMPMTGWASSLLAVGAVLVSMVIVFAILGTLMAGLVMMVVGLPVFLIAIVVCAIFAPVLLPFVILMALAMAFFCTLGGVLA
jgi:hypothetical protein